MPFASRSGISIDVSEGLSVVDAIPADIDLRRGPETGLGAAPVYGDRDLLISDALQKKPVGMEIVEGFTICPPPEDDDRRSGNEDPRRRAKIDIPVEAGQSAVVLAEEDGVYRWLFGERGDAAVAGTIVIDLNDGATEDADEEERRSRLRRWLMKPIRALVIRIAGFVGVGAVVALAEVGKRSALIDISSEDDAEWSEIEPAAVARKLQGGRVLLFVHGTFSSTRGSFGGLTKHPAGIAFLAHARNSYDSVIGFEHRSLSPTPEENSADLADLLEGVEQGMELDVVAYSRGGMVARYLIEHEIPNRRMDVRVRRCVLVGCTNGGTNLANPDRWHELADWYTTLAIGVCSIAERFPTTALAAEAISEILESTFAFVKHLSTAVVSDEGVPGIAAMEPSSEQVTKLNVVTADHPPLNELDYCVIDSDYRPPQEAGGMKILASAAQQLFRGPSDLVVDTVSMSELRPEALKESMQLGRYSGVHHLAYFFHDDVARQLQEWLRPR